MTYNSQTARSLCTAPELELVEILPGRQLRLVADSIHHAEEAARLAAAGYDLALVGSALMRAADPLQLVRDMLSAGRAART